MPLWRIFAHPSVFTPEQKHSISQSVTEYYRSGGLPAFYVVVIFIDTPEGSVYVGGVEKKNFVRIVTEHIARHFDGSTEAGSEQRRQFMERISEKIIKPHFLSRPELEFEHHILETPRDLWRIQNIAPPPSFSQEEKTWIEANKPIPYY